MQKNKNINYEDYSDLIWSIVHKLLSQINGRYYYNGLEEDLYQEGFIGLIEASNKYVEELSTQFSTFSYKYIYGYCLNYLKKEFISLSNEDIDSSPDISKNAYDMDYYFEVNLINEINNKLRVTNRQLSKEEENILEDRLLKELSLQECAKLNNCSTKKITNVINKYKGLIKEILIN